MQKGGSWGEKSTRSRLTPEALATYTHDCGEECNTARKTKDAKKAQDGKFSVKIHFANEFQKLKFVSLRKTPRAGSRLRECNGRPLRETADVPLGQ